MKHYMVRQSKVYRMKFLHVLKFIFFVIIINGFIYTDVKAQTAEDIKSASIEKLTRFIEWPNDTNLNEYFIIGITGENPFGNILKRDYKTRKIKDRQVVITEIRFPEEAEKCDLLFISESESDRLEGYLKLAFDNHILTVSDSEGFGENGVHINFYIEDEHIRFEINLNELKDSGFRAGSLLLGYAKIVETKQKK